MPFSKAGRSSKREPGATRVEEGRGQEADGRRERIGRGLYQELPFDRQKADGNWANSNNPQNENKKAPP